MNTNVEKAFKCGRCLMTFERYEILLEHLYWRHGTESTWCSRCPVKKWRFAVHKCHVLPVEWTEVQFKDDQETRSYEYCFCGVYVSDAPMIGCDEANCPWKWYHFSCVGISAAPDGDWYCPSCKKS